MGKQLDVRIQNKIDSKTNWDAATFTSLTGEMYIYQSTDMPKIRFGDGVSTVKNLQDVDKDEGSSATVVAVPSTQTFTYNGSAQGLSYNTSAMQVVSGQASAVVPATYSATFKLNSGYKWSDNSTSNKTVSWSITNAPSKINIATTSITLTEVLTPVKTTVSLSGASSYTVYVQYSDRCSATRNTSDNKLEVTPGTKNGITGIVLTTVPDTYYDAATIIITVENKVAVSTTLEDNDWSLISQVSRKGKASSTWHIGDTKSIVLNGTIGPHVSMGATVGPQVATYTNYTTYVYILDFYYSAASGNTIFGTFKNAQGQDYCLIDDNLYGTAYDTGSCTYFHMKNYNGNCYGGWKESTIRYYVLGSTDSIYNDASSTTATNPVPNTLMAALPADLRNVLVSMYIDTNNEGIYPPTSNAISGTEDYLPLLSEYEVFGSVTYADPQEGYYGMVQPHLRYFADGNTRIKGNSTSNTTATVWWLRSPAIQSGGYGYCCVNYAGSCTTGDSATSYGVAPMFSV